ncbi:MAG: recombinase family protein [Alphaproteobacteria bacterium]|nr:recombinase family protein [Alphaproteobacteria bacterium]
MAVVGYGRVSSAGQSLDVQVEQLKAVPCDRIFTETRSGTSTEGRAALEEMMRYVREGDVLVVTRLDRLARSLTDLSRIIDELGAKGVGFRCLQQGAVDTTKPEGRLMLQLLGSVAEFETAIRKDRQMEGIAKAKAAGKYRGRPQSIQREQIEALEAEGLGPTAIAKRLGIGRSSVYRVRGADKSIMTKTA